MKISINKISCKLFMLMREVNLRQLIILFFVTVVNTAYSGNNELSFNHFSVQDGLASTYVKGIVQDKDGFIWIITRENVCRFDGIDFREFTVFDHNSNRVKLLPSTIYMFSDSLLLCESMENYFYYFDFQHECFKPFDAMYSPIKKRELSSLSQNELVFIQGNELCKLNLKTNKVVISNLFSKYVKISSEIAFVSTYANKNYLFAATNQGELYELHKESGKQKKYSFPTEFANDDFDILFVDNKNNIWFRVYNNGVIRFSRDTGKFIHFKVGSKYPILHDLVHCVISDDYNRIWIGNESGLSIWDEERDEVYNYQYDKLYPQGLNTNPIYNSFKDKDGHIWLGTYFGGINLWNSNKSFFKSWTAGQSPYHLVGNVVSTFAEDNSGNLWIGTEDMGINKLDLNTGMFEKGDDFNSSIQLSYNNVHNLTFVDENTLWIATYSGGINIYNIKTHKTELINTNNNHNLPSNFIYSLIKIGNQMYIGCNNGAATYNLKTKQLVPFFPSELQSEIVAFAESNKILWIATNNGILSYGLEDNILTNYTHLFENAGINQIVCDSKNQIWIATNSLGLIKFDYKTEKLTYFNESTGFPVNRIFAFVEGSNGSFWVSSNKGLINFNENLDLLYVYDNNSGIAFDQFNFRAGYKDKNGQIYFGGNNGMVAFNETNSIDNQQCDVVFTEFSLFNKPVVPGDKSPINEAINQADKIALKYKQNVFTIGFAAINYTQPGQNVYAYMLEGFDKTFNYMGNLGLATYTNLDPGKYLFKVKTSDNSWRNESEIKSIPIIIKPPFWRSWAAYVIYFVLFISSIIIFYFITTSIQKSKAAIEIERREKSYMEEMNQAKLEFFTNISHEIKTPLTLILGPLVKVIKDEKIPLRTHNSLHGIYRNVRRLKTLLDELLEFRKIERGSMKLSVYKITDFTFINDIKEDFSNLAKNINIVFEMDYPKSVVEIWFNQSILEKIIYNLLSNAFKYGAEGKIISCKIEIEETYLNNIKEKKIRLSVVDHGKGISDEDINKIFERFYQVSNQKSFAQGVGIGLSFVKSLVDLHHGEIKIESTPNESTEFTVILPVSKNHYSEDEIKDSNASPSEKFVTDISIMQDKELTVAQKSENIDLLQEKPTIQLVDDNVELLSFIKELLADKYIVFTNENGKEAYTSILKNNPELIISDVMMPEIDGYELTRMVKENIQTSHIPVILLTAKGGQENCYEGLKYGADLYIEKPFYPPIFEQQVNNIITARRNLIKKFKTDVLISPTETTHSKKDKEFVSKLTEVINENIDKSDIDVTFLINKLNISRSLLHLKLKSLVNCSTTEFVRNVRMRKAMDLIMNEKCSYSEAGYKTGFSSPAYFSRCFKEIYGKSPREYFKKALS